MPQARGMAIRGAGQDIRLARDDQHSWQQESIGTTPL